MQKDNKYCKNRLENETKTAIVVDSIIIFVGGIIGVLYGLFTGV